jgi:hypothetical protein
MVYKDSFRLKRVMQVLLASTYLLRILILLLCTVVRQSSLRYIERALVAKKLVELQQTAPLGA